MPEPATTCSLAPADLRRRLDEIAAVGATGLVDATVVGADQRLRFHADEETRRQLEEIVAAECRCCSFLDLTLEEVDDELVLTVAAPRGGQEAADQIAASFAGGTR